MYLLNIWKENDHVNEPQVLFILLIIIKVLANVDCMMKCPIATIFPDCLLTVIKQDRKRLRLDLVAASAFERVAELTDG